MSAPERAPDPAEHAHAPAAEPDPGDTIRAVMARDREVRARIASVANTPRASSRALAIVTAVATAASLYLWFGDPAWLRFSDARAVDPVRRARAARAAVYLAASRVEQFRATAGRLPLSIEETGPPVAGVRYVRADDRQYQILCDAVDPEVRYHSSENLSRFLGSTLADLGLKGAR